MEHILEAADYLRSVTGDFKPEIGIILGTGLGDFADNIDERFSVEYKDIPHSPVRPSKDTRDA